MAKPHRKRKGRPEDEENLVANYRDPVLRPPIFSPHPWEGHQVHNNPVHSDAPTETLVKMARKHTVEAVLTLVYHMRNPYDPELSVRAAELLLERGWGKTPQVIGLVDGSDGADAKSKLSVEERRRILMAQVESGMTAEALDLASLARAKPVTPEPAAKSKAGFLE